MKKQNILYFVILGFIILCIIAFFGLKFYSGTQNILESSTEIEEVPQFIQDNRSPRQAELEEKEAALEAIDFVNNPTRDKLIKVQQLLGPDIVIGMDCSIFEIPEDAVYCDEQKELFTKIANQITWESIITQGDEYALSYDCSLIEIEIGQDYCTEFQTNYTNN